MITLSIIIPVYNEERTVKLLINQVKRVKLRKIKKEIIVVNDGSVDQTRAILKKIPGINLFHHRKNKGKGQALRTGIKKATGDLIIFQDADLEYNPTDFNRLILPILLKKEQVVYGSRLKNYPLRLWGKNKTLMPSHWLGNHLLSFITRVLYRVKLTDMETCYKVFEGELIKSLTLKSTRFEIEPEITAKILKLGIKIYEIPIKVKLRSHKQGKKIKWTDGFLAIWTLVKYRFTD